MASWWGRESTISRVAKETIEDLNYVINGSVGWGSRILSSGRADFRFDFIQSLKYATALSEKLSVLGILPGIIKGVQSNHVNLPWTQLQYRYGRLAKTTRP